MTTFDFDFELNFTNTFDPAVIADADIPDKEQAFVGLVNTELLKIENVLNLYPGIKTMSSFAKYNFRTYKLNLTKS